jgi:predicted outer membrane repeat protein
MMKPLYRLSTKTLTCVAVTAILCGNGYAQDLFVSTAGADIDGKGFMNPCVTESTPCKTLGHALEEADQGNGDTIILTGGTYSEHDLVVPKELTIRAKDSNRIPTIDAQGAGRHFSVSLPGLTVKLQDLKLINGNATAAEGGSIYVNAGTLELSNSTVSSNYSAYNGGAIACVLDCEDLLVTDSRFESNSSDIDGGAVSSVAPTTIESSMFRSNSASTGNGGAVAESAGGKVPVLTIIRDSQFTGNTAKSGGAFFGSLSTAYINESSFIENTSENYGSAIHFLGSIFNDALRLSIVNSTLADNIAGLSGTGSGAVYINQAFGYWSNLSFVDNLSTDDGRHVYAYSSTIEMTDSYFYTSPNQFLTESCISDNPFISVNNLWEDAGNICFDPLSHVKLDDGSLSPLGRFGPFGDLDGTTLSYLLLDGSNAIDAGSNCNGGIDQRGAIRGEHVCDIGATEEQGIMINLD